VTETRKYPILREKLSKRGYDGPTRRSPSRQTRARQRTGELTGELTIRQVDICHEAESSSGSGAVREAYVQATVSYPKRKRPKRTDRSINRMYPRSVEQEETLQTDDATIERHHASLTNLWRPTVQKEWRADRPDATGGPDDGPHRKTTRKYCWSSRERRAGRASPLKPERRRERKPEPPHGRQLQPGGNPRIAKLRRRGRHPCR